MTKSTIGIVLVLAGGSVACSKKPPAPVDAGPASSVAVAPPPSARPATTSGGWAYLTIRSGSPADKSGVKKALVAIDPSGGIARVAMPGASLETVVRASDGQAYALLSRERSVGDHAIEVMRLAGTTMHSLGTLSDCLSVTGGSSFDARGDLLVLGCASVRETFLFEKKGEGSWTKSPAPSDKSSDVTVWISKSGALFYATEDKLHERVDAKWTEVKQPKRDESYNFREVSFLEDSGGAHLASRFHGLMRVRDGALEPVRPAGSTETLTYASANGTFAVADPAKDTLRLDTLASEGKAVGIKTSVAGASLDDHGRAWEVNEDGQLEVVDGKSGGSIRLPLGAYAALDYLDGGARIVVLGSGPAIPPPRPARHTKQITGTIVRGGKPIAGAAVEVCTRYVGSNAPCSGWRGISPDLVFKAKTDERGRFAVADVPMGTFYVHWKEAGADPWNHEARPLLLRENAVSDVGALPREP